MGLTKPIIINSDGGGATLDDVENFLLEKSYINKDNIQEHFIFSTGTEVVLKEEIQWVYNTTIIDYVTFVPKFSGKVLLKITGCGSSQNQTYGAYPTLNGVELIPNVCFSGTIATVKEATIDVVAGQPYTIGLKCAFDSSTSGYLSKAVMSYYIL